ncbi:DegT/DnrJ/EryC1/StrS family aminotransferase [Selenomonas sputigena]|uniref:DegT/DnrJ/EryC1/StrS family aminotransferase n=1 Tax=Selenomonas sputigena TaxID=69823 RepID=UPI0022345CFF|nr:DegT/DnrJ/EryC1/StrS family aminotransferase [Selenomonas sputigena]UZE45116.1 DegT/DnrJ/EryC1/StrS family aminotransferase [Selenomonas sputigena]
MNSMKERKIPFSPPDITEEEIAEVSNALRSGWITTGPRTKQLEKEVAAFCESSNGMAVCLNSATAALELSLRVLGIGVGDEVITSAYTYTASASVIDHVGAKIVLIDTQPGSYEMDYDQLEQAISTRTKAIIPVDLGGVPCDYDRLFGIVERQREKFFPRTEIQRKIGRVAIVADGAHAFGASYKGKKIGSVADFTSFSFHAVKNFTTAEGGAALWKSIPGVDDAEIYHEYQLLSLHGQNKDALAKTKLGAWEYDIKGTYYKCNMTDVLAAIGLVQMKRYSGLLVRRREIIAQYDKGLKDLPVEVLPHFTDVAQGSGHLYLVRLLDFDEKKRNLFIEKMAEKGVATNVHYKPLPMHTVYKNLGFDVTAYPNAYAQYANEVTLPLHTSLTDEDVDYVVSVFREVYQEMRI